MASVAHVKIRRTEVRADKVPLLKSIFKLERLPLANSEVEIEIGGVPTAVVNALRRVVLDEMTGYCLQVPAHDPAAGFDSALTTDVFMLPQFVNERIACVPLRPRIDADIVDRLRLSLDVHNGSAEVMAFYTGDFKSNIALAEPLFNPTFKLGFLQPGKRIVIKDVRVAAGRGRDHAAFSVARRAAHRHLDLPEYTREETHSREGVALDLSGYKISSLVADPRRHVLRATIPATSANPAEVRAVFADACASVTARLRQIAAALAADVRQSDLRQSDSRQSDSRQSASADGIQYSVVKLDSGPDLVPIEEGILIVPGETSTVGELIRRAVYDATPEISYVSQVVVDHENALRVTLRHSDDVTRMLRDAVAASIAVFTKLAKGIMSAPAQS